MNKILYLLDPATGALVGQSLHPLDPVETELRGEPVYALFNPALATDIAPPPVPVGMQARMADGVWLLEAVAPPPALLVPAEVPEPAEPPPATFEQRKAALLAVVQEYMDAMARALGYDDIKTAVTYAEEPAVPKFQHEARALRAWRSRVWAKCYALVELVRKGEAEEPTATTLASLLPALEIPRMDEPVQLNDAGPLQPPAAQPPEA